MRTEVSTPLRGRRLLVAVSGSIAAVKTPLLVSGLVKAGAEVRCLVTPSAARLVSPLALATLSRHRCYQEDDEWDSSCSRPLHIELAEWAELVLVAPLSANSLSRWSQGSAEGLLASVLLACECPVLAAIAMNTAMWNHPAVQRNWELVQTFPGVVPLLPQPGLLACDRHGDGRMADPLLIELAATSLFSRGVAEPVSTRDWSGRRLLVTAGPTVEPIDQARLITNRSSGAMGVLLAQAARLRGAEVALVHGPLQVPEPWLASLHCHPVQSAAEMQMVLQQKQADVDAIAMAAAVADLRRVATGDVSTAGKAAKADLALRLSDGWELVPDLLQGLAARRPAKQTILGFAALTGEDAELLSRGEEKRLRKGCDLLFVNPIDRSGQGFGQAQNGGWLLGNGWSKELPVTGKLQLAHQLLDALLALRQPSPASPVQADR